MISPSKRSDPRKKHAILSSVVMAMCVLAVSMGFIDSMLKTESKFTSSATAKITTKADTLAAPANIKISNTRVGETDISWDPSSSDYATGYNVYRASVVAGPWTKIGSTDNRTKVTFVDKTSGAKSYFYKIETTYNNWFSSATSFVAPPAVGRSFFDDFNGSFGDLNGKVTEDGSSTWQVWSGEMSTTQANANVIDAPYEVAAYGTPGYGPSPNNGDVAVVRTPVNDGWVFASDLDGYERVILRGKDPNNYIYAGGAEVINDKNALVTGYFEIAEIRNGIKHVLMTTNPGDNKNFRVEVQGDKIRAYIDAVKTDPNSGTLHMEVVSTFQQTDPLATYFGIGFNRGGFGINDFTFEAFD